MIFTCSYCGTHFEAKPSERLFSKTFCKKAHYHEWQRSVSQFPRGDRLRDYDRYKRRLWGGSGKSAKEVGAWARSFAQIFEEIAYKKILPKEQFTDIDNWANHSNVFFIDFIATKGHQRVLVNVTSKWAAWVPDKARFARSLRMPLFILHISPANPDVYWLKELPNTEVPSKVPLGFFHQLHDTLGSPIQDWPDRHYGITTPPQAGKGRFRKGTSHDMH